MLTILIIEQNKLFDDLNKESPTITLNNGPKSVLNAGGSKIFEVPPSNVIVDAAPKELPKKRVKCKLSKFSQITISIARKLAEPSQSPLESSSEEDFVSEGSEYVPAYRNKTKERNRVKMEVERPRSSSKKTRKTRDSTTKLKRTKVYDFKSSSEDEELGIVRKPCKVEKTPVLHKKAEDKISRKTKFFSIISIKMKLR